MLKTKINLQNKYINGQNDSIAKLQTFCSQVIQSKIQLAGNKTAQKDIFTAEYDLNDVKVHTKNILTKGQTHDEILQYSGASVSTRGKYISAAEKVQGSQSGRSLYLFIQAFSKHSITLAIQKINEIIANDSGQQTSRMSKFTIRPPPSMASQQNSVQPTSTFIEKLMVGLDHAPPTFNLREQIIGASGANLNYIRNETGAIATLRGRGSLFIDPVLGLESPEPLHLYIEHPRFDGLQAAKQLAKNLIETLQQELIHFQQLSQSSGSSAFQNGGTIVQQGQQVTQINIPPPMLAVPPPLIQQNTLDSQTNQTAAIVQQNFIQQNPPPTLGGPPQTVQSQPQTIIHQQIIPQTVPIHHLQQANMVIQQPVQHPPTIGNVNIPPPSIALPIKTGQIVQFQGPPPTASNATHLTQPPPSMQLQHQHPTATQIVLNHPHNYQYQYIQQTNEQQIQPNQVTIQHIYQPQQQLQNIVQQAPVQQPSQGFEQFQQVRPPQIQAQQSQQYITVQGSTTYMVPPPAIIHQQATSQQNQQVQAQITTSNPNIIFQPPPPLQQVQMHVTPTISVQNIPTTATALPPPATTCTVQQDQSNQTNNNDDNDTSNIKEECKISNDNPESPSNKSPNDDKNETDSSQNDDNSNSSSHAVSTQSTTNTTTTSSSPSQLNISVRQPPPPPPQLQQQQQQQSQPINSSIQLPVTQVPPPVMAVPPPISCVQHFVGNTLITTHPSAQTQTHQIYNHVPVSLHQIQSAGQQIHVSTPNGQHFVVSAAPQWQTAPPPTAQQLQANGTIQNVQIAHQQIGPNTTDFRSIPPPGTTLTNATQPQSTSMMTINPQVQVQFQPQMIQQIPSSQTIESAQIIGGQITHHPAQQFNVVQSQHQQFPNCAITPVYQQATIMPSFQQVKQITLSDQPQRLGQKRKLEEDDVGLSNHQPRVGMGPRDHIQQQTLAQVHQQYQHHQQGQDLTSISNSQSLNSGSSNNISTNSGQDENNRQKSQSDVQLNHQRQQSNSSNYQTTSLPQVHPPSNISQLYSDNRPFYQRELNDGFLDGPPPLRPPFDGIHGPRIPPRFHHNNSLMGGPGFPMRPPLHMQDISNGGNNFALHRMNFCPPPPPPNGGYGPPPHSRFRGQW